MSNRTARPLGIVVALLLAAALGACGTTGGAGRAADRVASGAVGPEATLPIPTWPEGDQSLVDPEVGQLAAGPGAAASSAAPTAGPASPGDGNAQTPAPGASSAGSAGSAATDATVLSLSQQADRTLQELEAALEDAAADPIDEGGLP